MQSFQSCIHGARRRLLVGKPGVSPAPTEENAVDYAVEPHRIDRVQGLGARAIASAHGRH